jgi:hypothetical protein
MLKVLRAVRAALKQWQRLPPDERERYKGQVQRIRSLVAELGGARAVGYVDGDCQAANVAADGHASASRPKTAVITDLQDETNRLLVALAPPAAALAKQSVPKSARLGGKVAAKGLRQAARRYAK